MAGQLWYLSEELVGLALFDDDLDNGTKDKMASAMKEKEREEEPLKRATIDLKFVQDKTVVDFDTKNSKRRFKNLDVPEDFIYLAAQSSFVAAKSFIITLAVTNDHAECRVALIEDFSGHLTKDEDQLQFALHVVADHRKSFL